LIFFRANYSEYCDNADKIAFYYFVNCIADQNKSKLNDINLNSSKLSDDQLLEYYDKYLSNYSEYDKIRKKCYYGLLVSYTAKNETLVTGIRLGESDEEDDTEYRIGDINNIEEIKK